MILTTRTLTNYLSELNDYGWDYRLVAGRVDDAYQLWIATYSSEGVYTGEAVMVFAKTSKPRRMSRKGSVECYARRHGLQDKLLFQEGAL